MEKKRKRILLSNKNSDYGAVPNKSKARYIRYNKNLLIWLLDPVIKSK